jgi:HD-GYP domain-containing protein (c-di-GMP phosphodiesterase class II)
MRIGRQVVNVVGGFRRRLFLRLAVAGLLAAVVGGIAAFLIQTERLDEFLIDHAAMEAEALRPLMAAGLGKTEVERGLRSFLVTRNSAGRNSFVLAELYDLERKPLGEGLLDGHGFVEDHFDRSLHQFPVPGATWYAKTMIRGAPYFQVMVPLTDGGGRPAGWFEGIYHLAPATVAAVREDVAQITGLVVAIVLLTAGLLYPLMASLQDNVLTSARGLLRANIETLKVLGNAIAKRDSDTNAHNYRVTIYAVRIAERLGLAEAEIRSLIKGAFLHDVGKIAVPDAILLKPGKLDEAEFTEMKTHVRHGLDIIAANGWLGDAVDVVGGHHEKVDGSGYPQGLSGGSIPLSARIFAIADVFDALTSERPYKKPMSVETTMEILHQGRERHFDGAILDAFTAIMPDLRAEIAGRPDAEVEALAERVLATYFEF